MKAICAFLVLFLSAVSAVSAPLKCHPLAASAKNLSITKQPDELGLWLGQADASAVASWWCDKRYEWQPEFRIVFRRNLVPDWMAIAATIAGSSDIAVLQAVDDQYLRVPAPCSATAPDSEFRPLCPIALLQLARTHPEPILWEVRDNPAPAISRPVFPFDAVAGVRITTPTGERVSDVTTRCACEVRALEESGGTYCDVSGLPNVATANPDDVIAGDRLALCVRKN